MNVYRYSEPNTDRHEGWYIAFIDEAGALAVLSDYGDFCYRWNIRGTDRPIRQFLLECHREYILSKIARKDKYDGDRTLTNVRSEILRMRMVGGFSEGEARDEWDGLKYESIELSEANFNSWYSGTRLGDVSELVVYDYPPMALAFIEYIWPRLLQQIQKDLAQ